MKEGVQPWHIILSVVPLVITVIILIFIVLKRISKDLD